eukprot:1174029-Prorocentrum_minimum.AAC.1
MPRRKGAAGAAVGSSTVEMSRRAGARRSRCRAARELDGQDVAPRGSLTVEMSSRAGARRSRCRAARELDGGDVARRDISTVEMSNVAPRGLLITQSCHVFDN